MYPFAVLGLPEDTDDETVQLRYQELVRTFPPDRAPEEFRLIRQAYEALRDERSRLETRLLYFDTAGTALLSPSMGRILQGRRRRRTPEETAAVLRKARGGAV